MKVGSKLQFEVPDSCEDDCKFREDLQEYGQNSICGRCPVLICTGDDPLVEPEGYRADWAEEWVKFFAGEVEEPTLTFMVHKNNEEK